MTESNKTSATASALAQEEISPDEQKRGSESAESDGTSFNDPSPDVYQGNGENWVGRVVIEIATPRNGKVLWGPNEQILRGAWRKSNCISDERPTILENMPDIPGMRIEIDNRIRRLSIFDPLASPEFREVLQRAKANFKVLFDQDPQPLESVINNNPSNTEIKTWLFWARRFVDGVEPRRDRKSGLLVTSVKAVLIEGSLPTYEVIDSLPGQTKVDFFNSNVKGKRFLEDRDEVED